LACPDDEVAKEHARSLVDGHDVELWRGARQIAKFKHKPSKAPQSPTKKPPLGVEASDGSYSVRVTSRRSVGP
jgi:hypothetical protein